MMPTPPLTNEQCIEAVAAVARHHGSHERAAAEPNLNVYTLKGRLKRASERGLAGTDPVMPGFRIARVSTTEDATGAIKSRSITQKPDTDETAFSIPQGHRVKGVSALVDGNGNVVQQWLKTREGEVDPTWIADTLKTAFGDYEPAARPTPAPAHPSSKLLTLYPTGDWHLGGFAWKDEVGQNWDLKIAERTIGDSFDDLMERSPSSATAIILSGGDLLHADNSENRTARSGHNLDVDGRYAKVLMTATRLKVRTVEAALRRHERVIVRVLPGNHDEHSAVAVAYFLLAWFRNEPRVTVDVDPGLFFWHRHGLNLIGATHGHTVKIQKMPSIMANRRAEDWGQTRFRFVHGFHLHHTAKFGDEIDGVMCEIHQSPAAQDAWHHGAGYLSGRSLQAITYHEGCGEFSRVRNSILEIAS
jgi:hypothetical protein